MKSNKSLIILATLFLVGKVISAEFEFHLQYNTEIKGGEVIAYTFSKIEGTPTCKINAKRYDGNSIPEESVIVDGDYRSIAFNTNAYGSVPNNFTFVASINCVDGSDSVSFELKTFVLKDDPTDPSAHSICPIEIQISSVQKSSSTLKLLCGMFTGTCSASVVDSSKANIDKTSPITINYNDIEIMATKSGSSDSALIRIDCTLANIQTSSNTPVYFTPGADPWATATGDPHFKQIIFDQLHSMNQPICYDVTGTPDSYLKLVEYLKIGTQIYGQLKDDYYMHRVIIKSLLGNITISMNSVTIHNRTQLNWMENSKRLLIQSEGFTYDIFSNEILITILGETPIKVRIERKRHSLEQLHLDVSFKFLPKDYEEMSGLLGHIGKKDYKFYSSVQSNSDISNSKVTTIAIDDNLIFGRKVERNGKYCWLMDVDDILKPLQISQFFSNSIN
ncbi:DgyrCDS14972 [Dimorphilus gyrociliatus]|uniref:DgyrCDS14972 n=1 Tax=Dimorphilus gyrociliatus TaxID=2664684 RepID=A0A7I8WFM4_9ANNE|nr:DgyrCDS14972 [Dimorphilus gyrociliatus]